MSNLIRGFGVALLLAALPLAADAGVFVSVNIGPPALPVYVPPPMPAPGYLWTPGYWAWDGAGYYWVPGTWVLAPAPGLLWTPGYWGWAGGLYVWHGGYWGPHVGFYGGINYGFGYSGVGYHGGYWRGSEFVVNREVINERPINRVSFNGGAGGVIARASPVEMRAEHERHMEMSEMQREHEHLAAHDEGLRASFNHGTPRVAATARPGVFSGHGVVAAAHAGGAPGQSPHPLTGEPYGGHEQPHGAYAQSPHSGAYPQGGGSPHGGAYPQGGGYPHGGAYPQAGGPPHGGAYPQGGGYPHGGAYPGNAGQGGHQGGQPHGAPGYPHQPQPQPQPQGRGGEHAEHGGEHGRAT